jgi:hypothetical protein
MRRLTDVRQPNLSHVRPQASHPYETSVAFAKLPHVVRLAGDGSRVWRRAGKWQGLDGSPLSSSGEALRSSGDEPGVPAVAWSREHFRAGATGRDALRGTRKPFACRLSVDRGRPRSSSRSRFRLLTGPCQALGAGTTRDAEVRGDLACRRLGSERKHVKRIYARDTGNVGRQFARQVDAAAATDLR